MFPFDNEILSLVQFLKKNITCTFYQKQKTILFLFSIDIKAQNIESIIVIA